VLTPRADEPPFEHIEASKSQKSAVQSLIMSLIALPGFLFMRPRATDGFRDLIILGDPMKPAEGKRVVPGSIRASEARSGRSLAAATRSSSCTLASNRTGD
jgi:hypothetical protein